MSSTWIAVVVTQWIVIVLLVLVTIGILRYLAFFRERMELAAPPSTARHIGDAIPELQFLDLSTRSPFKIPSGRSSLLLFVSVTCGGCSELLTQVEGIVTAGRRNPGTDLAVVVIEDEPDKFATAWPIVGNASPADVRVLTDSDGAAAKTFPQARQLQRR